MWAVINMDSIKVTFMLISWQMLLYFTCCSSTSTGLSYVPYVGNIAIGRLITANSTCGVSGQEQFCSQDYYSQSCELCDNTVEHLAHPPQFMIDYGDSISSIDRTWWQSKTTDSPVLIDINFDGMFFFTHVIISFKSHRPALMEILKSSDFGSSYQLLQYYSVDCENDLLPNELCTPEYSDNSHGEVIYTVPSNQLDLSNIPNITLTNLRILLLKQHNAGNISDPQVSIRQFYAIYNIEVFGWCFCNGHETECVLSEKESTTFGMVPSVCACGNNTTGQYCNVCLSSHNGTEWKSGFSDAKGCQECDCNNRSSSCDYYTNGSICHDCLYHFDGDHCQYCSPGYYYDNGSCIACQCNVAGSIPGSVCSRTNGSCTCHDTVTGQKCDQCKPGFYNLSISNPIGCQVCSSCDSCDMFTGRCPCQPSNTDCCPFDQYHNGVNCTSCDCHVNGSYHVCHADGTCVCKPGVGGDKCDKCLAGYHSLTNEGCVPCNCNQYGSNDVSYCSNITGQCDCLPNVGGITCNRCPANTLGPVRNGVIPCIPCFCNGYSDRCESQSGWYWAQVTSADFTEWQPDNDHSQVIDDKLYISSGGSDTLKINFPMSYLSDKRTSYGLQLSISMPILNCQDDILTHFTFTISGMLDRDPAKLQKSLSLSCNDYKIPLIAEGFIVSRPYTPSIKSCPADEGSIRKILSNILAMELQLTFKSDVPITDRYANISNVTLPYATNTPDHKDIILPLIPAPVAESCICPPSRIGNTCNFCAQNYTQEPRDSDMSTFNEFAVCGICFCNGGPTICDPITGICSNCPNNRGGHYCQKCADGYYYSINSVKCLPCDCPGGPNSRNQFASTCSYDNALNDIICHNCPEGFTGNRCDRCSDGYHGNPTFENGTCQLCRCSNNANGDANICDNITGDCLCAEGYTGLNCEFCQLGYHGDALSHNCQRCDCDVNGTVPGTHCDLTTGQCECKENVVGLKCTECATGYWNFGECKDCNCSSIGSVSTDDCDKLTGQCDCNIEYDGQTCTLCKDGYWNSNGTCIECECNLESSVSQICDKLTGACSCKEGVIGMRCDRCINDKTNGLFPLCEPCDECSIMWFDPIEALENATNNEIERIEAINVRNISHTEVNEITQPLLDLIMNTTNALNSSTIAYLIHIVLETHQNITEHILVIENLITRANVVWNILDSVNQTLELQLFLLQNITNQLNELKNLYINIVNETNQIGLTDFSEFVTRIEAAVNSSNATQQVILTEIIPTLDESQEQLKMFSNKNSSFIKLSLEVVRLLSLLREKFRNYQNLVIEADKLLCGKVIEYNNMVESLLCGCYSGEGCDGDCGGVACDRCGGNSTCNGSVAMVTRATDLTKRALELAEGLEESLQREVLVLREASEVSTRANNRSELAKELAEKGERNATELLSLIDSLTTSVRTMLSSSLPDTDIIDQLSDETLSISLSKTPEEIQDVLREINDTISKFRMIGELTDLRRRAEIALNVSILANTTTTYILRTITEVVETVQYIELNGNNARNRLNKAQENVTVIQETLFEISTKINITKRSLNRLSTRITNLNSSVEEIRNIFDRNSQRLNDAKNLSNETSKRVLKLQETARESEVKLSQVRNTTAEKQVQANRDLRNVETLRERMKELREKVHRQLLNSRNLQNRKSCLKREQEQIKDDIKRVAAELESLHSSIESTIGYNTICMRKSTSGK